MNSVADYFAASVQTVQTQSKESVSISSSLMRCWNAVRLKQMLLQL